ncbi:MAG TPA: phospholipase D-like domain-containing protein, partial [Microbacterium sp.]|nr:phospholipase D-like domain-containing protein [Microbacterium sp.]
MDAATLSSIWVISLFVLDLIIRVLAIIIVPRNRRPTAAMAWLLAIYFIPFVGVLLFLLIGNPRLPRKRRKQQEQLNTYIRRTSHGLDFGTLRPNAPAWFTQLVRLNRNLGAMPIAGDNGAVIISDYEQSLAAMAEAIRGAREYVHVEFYILQSDATTDDFFRALEEVAARGVTVRVLLDHWANRGKPFYRKTLKRLTAMGAQWHLMLPVQPLKGKYQRPDLRNHRKLLVVDGDVAF